MSILPKFKERRLTVETIILEALGYALGVLIVWIVKAIIKQMFDEHK